MIKKYMKNVSSEIQTVVNITLLPGETVELEPSMWAKVQGGDYLIPKVESGIIVMNDGINDLLPQDGIYLLYKWQEDTLPPNNCYAITASYSGNAGVGKYLEFFQGQNSNVNPFPIPFPSFIRATVLSAVSESTGTISFYKNFDFTTPILQVSILDSTYVKYNTTLSLSADDRISCKVTSGSINKPNIVLFIQTSV